MGHVKAISEAGKHRTGEAHQGNEEGSRNTRNHRKLFTKDKNTLNRDIIVLVVLMHNA